MLEVDGVATDTVWLVWVWLVTGLGLPGAVILALFTLKGPLWMLAMATVVVLKLADAAIILFPVAADDSKSS